MQPSARAWQPLTPGGVALFAQASLRNLWLVQLAFALLAAGALTWFIRVSWFPVVNQAIQNLPAEGAVRGQHLIWKGQPAQLLAASHFLAFAVDLQHERRVRSPAHLQIEFGARDVRVLSLLGLLELPYPQGYTIACNRPELEPWWGAWSPVILALTFAGTIVGLFLSWTVLALLYSPVAALIAFFADRDLRYVGAVKLCGAALMPGALFLSVSVFLYGLGGLDLVRLLAAAALHFLIGWLYVCASPFLCPRLPSPAPPFRKGPQSGNAPGP